MEDIVIICASIVSSVATAIVAYLTYRNIRLLKDVHESRFEPNVIVTLELDDTTPAYLIFLAIKNIGNGVAENITFKISRSIPQSTVSLSPQEPMTRGPLITGILSLAPGGYRKCIWGQYASLIDALGTESVEIFCSFTRGDKSMYKTHSYLDVTSFAENFASPNIHTALNENLKKIADNTKAIQQSLASINQKINSKAN